MRFSLVVCTRDRRNELVDLLDSLVRQNRTDFEVILVDQNTDNRLVEILARFAGRFPLKHIRMTGTGASRARNAGLDHVTGQLIGFPDDDCRYLDGYLEAVDQIFTEDPSIGCISGHPTAASDEELGRRLADAANGPRLGFGSESLPRVHNLRTEAVLARSSLQ
jgi:glycosyltransferase involved in cell wall biosynthesis